MVVKVVRFEDLGLLQILSAQSLLWRSSKAEGVTEVVPIVGGLSLQSG